MKKAILAVLICAIAVLGLAGCGKKAGTGEPAGHEHPKSEHPK